MTEFVRTFPATEVVAWLVLALVFIGSILCALLSWLLYQWQRTKRQTRQVLNRHSIIDVFETGARGSYDRNFLRFRQCRHKEQT